MGCPAFEVGQPTNLRRRIFTITFLSGATAPLWGSRLAPVMLGIPVQVLPTQTLRNARVTSYLARF